MNIKRLIVLVSLFCSVNVVGQPTLEEVIVTAQRSEVTLPGAVLKKTGDFLLLEVKVRNDTRNAVERKKEIYQTLKNAIVTASKSSSIELSTIESGFVMPLTLDNYKISLERGSRPDTSIAYIRVKTAIPSDVNKATKLVDDMKNFVDKVKVIGRTELVAMSSVDVSIVNPNQYRNTIVSLFSDDAKRVASSLGDEYRVVVEGIDRPVEWVRSGPLQLTLYIPYSYSVIPNNVHSITVFPEY